MPSISICIPTYNRSRYLAELLESIIDQGTTEVEIIISDDASSDDTSVVAKSFLPRIKNMKYIRQPSNIGLDRNFIAAASAASGEYIWFMGDDDRIEPNGLLTVIGALQRWPSVVGLTLGVIDYDVTMSQITGVRAIPKTQLLTGATNVFSSIPELLGFMSSMVVSRNLWMKASADASAQAMQNLYSQVYIMGRAVGKNGTWGVVSTKCVGFRSGNDQFKRKLGWLERLKIDARAYDEIADLLFAKDQVVHRAMRRRIFDTHIVARILNAKTNGEGSSYDPAAFSFLFQRYADIPTFWTRGLPLLIAPARALSTARRFYKLYNRNSGASRARMLTKESDTNIVR